MKTCLVAALLVAGAATSLAIEVIRPFDEPRRQPQEIPSAELRRSVECVIILNRPEPNRQEWDLFKPYYLEPGHPPLQD